MSREAETYDLFVSYASEDRAEVSELVAVLKSLGVQVWFDRFQLKVGDSLRRTIDLGLVSSRFGAVILSPSFFGKHYPERELDGLAQREIDGTKVILPVWKDVTAQDVRSYSPPLADRIAADMANGVIAVAASLLEVVRPDLLARLRKTAPVQLPRVTKGSQVAAIIRGSHMSMVYNDEVANEAEADLVGGFIQELRDLGDIWNDLEGPDQLRYELHISERIAELEEADWTLHAKREQRRLTMHGVTDVWNVADIVVVRSGAEAVMRMGDEVTVLRQQSQAAQ
ncbi:MAG TPA: toll/interleukin-1 receptor domain-containing protein [Candidatus Krumholzibacteria bacterium]|nr:toll/interleukin-1 receptor domain-containing protein [Candidatus Krumholzibacteria bacterium]